MDAINGNDDKRTDRHPTIVIRVSGEAYETLKSMFKIYLPVNAGSHLLFTVCILKNLTLILRTMSSSTYFNIRLLQFIVMLFMTFVTILLMYPGGASSL